MAAGTGYGYAPVHQSDSQSSHGSQSMNRSGQINTISSSSGSASSTGMPAGAGHRPIEKFPGRGTTLASAGSSSSSGLTDEEIKARRLAALSGPQQL